MELRACYVVSCPRLLADTRAAKRCRRAYRARLFTREQVAADDARRCAKVNGRSAAGLIQSRGLRAVHSAQEGGVNPGAQDCRGRWLGVAAKTQTFPHGRTSTAGVAAVSRPLASARCRRRHLVRA